MKQEKINPLDKEYWCPICESRFSARETYEVTTDVRTIRNHYSFGYDGGGGEPTRTLHTVCSTVYRLRKGIHGSARVNDPSISSEYRLIKVIGGDMPHERAG